MGPGADSGQLYAQLVRVEELLGGGDPHPVGGLVVVLHHDEHVAARKAREAVVAPDLVDVGVVEQDAVLAQAGQPLGVLRPAVVVDQDLDGLLQRVEGFDNALARWATSAQG